MAEPNYYELLGVSPAANAEDVKDAFRDMMYRYHPDHNPGKEDWAVERTMELVKAYHALTDPVRKSLYDLEVQNPVRRELKIESKGFALFSKKEDKEKVLQAEVAFRRGVELFDTPDKRTQAVAEFLKASRLQPTAWEALYNLGLSIALMGRFPEAIEVLGRAQRAGPDRPEIKRLSVRVSALAYGQK